MIITIKYLSGIVNCNHKNGCNRCTTIGEWSYDSKTVIFPQLDAPKRVDPTFRSAGYGAHHASYSPLVELDTIDTINDFPIGDSLHLIDLGITKRLINGWRSGTLSNVDSKLSSIQSKKISDYLDSIPAPFEIRSQRRIRGFNEIKSWKAIEYRNFLLYTSIVVLKYNIEGYIYEHFLLYFCAITIFSREFHLNHLFPVADKCLSIFLERFKIIYGKQFFSSNLHNLAHLSEDVQRFGSLETFNSYPFESKLITLSRLIRTGNLPLEQLANRVMEQYSIQPRKHNDNSRVCQVKRRVRDALFEELTQQYILYYQLHDSRIHIDCMRNEDSWILTKNKEIYKIQCIAKGETDSVLLYAFKLKEKHDYFRLPIVSSHLLIYCCAEIKFEVGELIDIENIRCKLFPISQNIDHITAHRDKITILNVFLPILKTLN